MVWPSQKVIITLQDQMLLKHKVFVGEPSFILVGIVGHTFWSFQDLSPTEA